MCITGEILLFREEPVDYGSLEESIRKSARKMHLEDVDGKSNYCYFDMDWGGKVSDDVFSKPWNHFKNTYLTKRNA